MLSLANPLVISSLLALVAGLLLYSVVVPRNSDKFSPAVGDGKDKRLIRLTAMLGSELYSALPQNVTLAKKSNPRIESLLVRSGNPWNLTAQEFAFFQIVTAFLGFLIGWALWFGLNFTLAIAWWIPVAGATILGYLFPKLRYNDQAKKRDLDFKRQIPEALDLIIISLSGGRTFTQALKDSLPNMQPGVLKEEFQEMVNGIATGRTLTEALDHFADRAPNESIKTFVQAVREASELDVPLVDVLQSRAEASRQEFFAIIHNKTAQLSSKMMAILTPTLIPALIIIVLTPALASLLSTLG